MIDFGKYGAYIISAYAITIGILLLLSIQTLIDFTKTKNKLDELSKKEKKS